MAKIGSDLIEFNGAHYLLGVDYYTRWIQIAKLDNLTSNNAICHLESHFARYGIPDELISDNGPQYASSAFRAFSNNYGFVHTTTSPYYPQSRGRGVLGSSSAGYVPLASQNPYPIIPQIIYIISGLFCANYKPHLSHFWANDFLTLKVPKKCNPILVILVTLLKMLEKATPL